MARVRRHDAVRGSDPVSINLLPTIVRRASRESTLIAVQAGGAMQSKGVQSMARSLLGVPFALLYFSSIPLARVGANGIASKIGPLRSLRMAGTRSLSLRMVLHREKPVNPLRAFSVVDLRDTTAKSAAHEVFASVRDEHCAEQEIGHAFLSGDIWDAENAQVFAKELMTLLPGLQMLICVNCHSTDGLTRISDRKVRRTVTDAHPKNDCEDCEDRDNTRSRVALWTHRGVASPLVEESENTSRVLMVYGHGDCEEEMRDLLENYRVSQLGEVDCACSDCVIARLAVDAVAKTCGTELESDVFAIAGVMKSGPGLVLAKREGRTSIVNTISVSESAIGVPIPFDHNVDHPDVPRRARIWHSSNHIAVRGSHFRVTDVSGGPENMKIRTVPTNARGASRARVLYDLDFASHLRQVIRNMDSAERLASLGLGMGIGLLHPFNGSVLKLLKIVQVNEDGSLQIEGGASRMRLGAVCDIRLIGGSAAMMSAHRVHSKIEQMSAECCSAGNSNGACVVLETIGSRHWYDVEATLCRTAFAATVCAVFDEARLATDGHNWLGNEMSSVGFSCP